MDYRLFDLLYSCLKALNTCSNQLDLIHSHIEDSLKSFIRDNLYLAEILVNDTYEGIKDVLSELSKSFINNG